MTDTDRDIRQYVLWLEEACRSAGLHAETDGNEVTIRDPHAPDGLIETIVIDRDESGEARWYWSWNEVIASANRVDDIVNRVARVVSLTRRVRERAEDAVRDAEMTQDGKPPARIPFVGIGDSRGVSWAERNSGPDVRRTTPHGVA